MVAPFCGNSQRVNAVGCFHGGAVSLMFDKILNATLSEEKVSTTRITQGNLELPLCFVLLLIYTKRKTII